MKSFMGCLHSDAAVNGVVSHNAQMKAIRKFDKLTCIMVKNTLEKIFLKHSS